MRKIGAELTIVVAAFVLAGCSSSPSDSTEETVSMTADYPQYQNVSGLEEGADQIFEGTVTSSREDVLLPEYEGTDPAENPRAGMEEPSQEELEEAAAPVTVYTVEVTKVFRGDIEPGSTVEIQQLGGVMDDVKYVESEVSNMEPGTTYAFFTTGGAEGSPLALLGGDQGLFEEISDGEFSPTSDEVTGFISEESLEELDE